MFKHQIQDVKSLEGSKFLKINIGDTKIPIKNLFAQCAISLHKGLDTCMFESLFCVCENISNVCMFLSCHVRVSEWIYNL